jgi:hypothetical protein
MSPAQRETKQRRQREAYRRKRRVDPFDDTVIDSDRWPCPAPTFNPPKFLRFFHRTLYEIKKEYTCAANT